MPSVRQQVAPRRASWGLSPLRAGLGLPGDFTADVTAPLASRFALPTNEELVSLFPGLEILGLVGQGGMGAVYKARQPHLDRIVALKLLPPEVGRDPTFAERFAREARTLARLSHNNIVHIHDSGQAGVCSTSSWSSSTA
jgi:serine/threonine protein kinase